MKDNYVLLLGKKNYLIKKGKGKFNTEFGEIDVFKVSKKKIGDRIKTHTGEEFVIVTPTLIDLLFKKTKRLPQIVTPMDASLILAYTGVPTNSLIVDAGAGSAFMAIFLGYYCCKGRVISYEINDKFAKVAKENVNIVGLKNIVIKNKDILKGIDEKNVDLITLDMKDAENNIKNSYKALKLGGWLVVYSPYIEQVKAVVSKMKEVGFTDIMTVENIRREWQIGDYTRPKTMGVMHTGWLTFGRKK